MFNHNYLETAMSKKRELVLGITGAMILPALWAASVSLAVAAPPGKPRAASSAVSRTGPSGNTATRQSNVATNGQGGYTAGTATQGRTTTGPSGRSASENRTVTVAPVPQTPSN
jgi:hypothetical protein